MGGINYKDLWFIVVYQHYIVLTQFHMTQLSIILTRPLARCQSHLPIPCSQGCPLFLVRHRGSCAPQRFCLRVAFKGRINAYTCGFNHVAWHITHVTIAVQPLAYKDIAFWWYKAWFPGIFPWNQSIDYVAVSVVSLSTHSSVSLSFWGGDNWLHKEPESLSENRSQLLKVNESVTKTQ